MKIVLAVLLFSLTCIFGTTASFATSLGFQTSNAQYYSISPSGQTATLSFGKLAVTNAEHNGSSFSSIVGAEVIISDVHLDLNSRNTVGSLAGKDLIHYALVPEFPIMGGFRIILNQELVLSGDLLLNDLYFFGKTGTLDDTVQLNVLSPVIHTVDPVLLAFFTDFGAGGDLNITMQDVANDDPAEQLLEMNDIQGIVGGTFSGFGKAIPEPLSITLFSIALLSVLKKRISHTIGS
ncbi:MAG: hypothetical protein AB1454_11175 [Candidatus Auribacterota bacterium]